MTYNDIYIVLDPTVMENDIDPILEHKASLKAFSYNEGTHMCEKRRFKFL